MQSMPALRLQWANERIARARADADRERLADEARHRHRQPLRQRAGHALIAAGRRLAAEPHPRLTARKALR